MSHQNKEVDMNLDYTLKSFFLIALGALLSLDVIAQEYDDMYYSSRDRKKEKKIKYQVKTPSYTKTYYDDSYKPSALTEEESISKEETNTDAQYSPSYINEYINRNQLDQTENIVEQSEQIPQNQYSGTVATNTVDNYNANYSQDEPVVVNNYYGNIYEGRDEFYPGSQASLGMGFNPYGWSFGFGYSWGYGVYNPYYWDPFYNPYYCAPYPTWGWSYPVVYRGYYRGYRRGYYDGYYGYSYNGSSRSVKVYNRGSRHTRSSSPARYRAYNNSVRGRSSRVASTTRSNGRRSPDARISRNGGNRGSSNATRRANYEVVSNGNSNAVRSNGRTSNTSNSPRTYRSTDSRSTSNSSRTSSNTRYSRTTSNNSRTYSSSPSRSTNGSSRSNTSYQSSNSRSNSYNNGSNRSSSSRSSSSYSSSGGRSSRSTSNYSSGSNNRSSSYSSGSRRSSSSSSRSSGSSRSSSGRSSGSSRSSSGGRGR